MPDDPAPSPDLPDLLPARMVNEFVYCPRLFYLEYVDGEWAHNADTLEGRFVHRRVDRTKGRVPASSTGPSAAADDSTVSDGAIAADSESATGPEMPASGAEAPVAGPDAPASGSPHPSAVPDDEHVHATSVALGSAAIGVTAVIDLLEAEDGLYTPIDYKKGSPPPVLDGVWEPDAVQIALQCLLLREHGYRCDGGEVYYHAVRKRIPVPLTGRLAERALEAVAEARALAASGNVPPPLVASPKCPRCSLVGICLPDETNLLAAADDGGASAAQAGETAGALRRLVAAVDDRKPLYVVEHGLHVGLDAGVLTVKKGKEKLDSIRLIDCSQVVLFGNSQISSQALREVVSRDLLVTHLSYGGWLVAVTTPPPRKNVDLRRRQFALAEDPGARLAIARAMVSGKIRNSRTLLRRNAGDEAEAAVRQLKALRVKSESAASVESLLGIEGSAARVYFEVLGEMVAPKDGSRFQGFDFDGRNRRPPRDPVNAMLSFAYSLLVKDLTAAVVGVGFDPFLGFLHTPRFGRPALALDLMEEFRPIVADSVVLGMVRTGEIARTDFVERAGGCAMTNDGRKRFIDAYERRVKTEVTHPLFGYAVSYRRVFELQARLLARVLNGEAAEYVAFRTR